MALIKVSQDLKSAIQEAAKRQGVSAYFGFTGAVDHGTKKIVKLTVAVSLLKDCETSYKIMTGDMIKPTYLEKKDPRFAYEVIHGVLEVTGTIENLFARKLLS